MSDNASAKPAYRTAQKNNFANPRAAGLRAVTTNGSVYLAILGPGKSDEVPFEGVSYTVRGVSNVSYNGDPVPEATTIGYAFDTGSLLILDDKGVWLLRSSPVTDLLVAVL